MPVVTPSVPELMEQADQEFQWEKLCRRCGLCCFEKGIDGKGRLITTAVPCRHLDVHTRLCRVYAHRQEIESDCIKLTPEIVANLKWLPEDCAYRRKPSASSPG